MFNRVTLKFIFQKNTREFWRHYSKVVEEYKCIDTQSYTQEKDMFCALKP